MAENGRAEYEAEASQASKNGIFLWCVSGVIYIWLSDDHRLLSLVGFLLLMPGIFIASFATIPFFFADRSVKAQIVKVRPYPKLNAVSSLVALGALRVGLTAGQMALPIIFVKVCARFLQ
jgi:hypothetical protein